ncbi:hypothetical protein NQ314_004040 [Rhamnusium bicolor]|uniref:Uncharacterized protein n=1 Tax=Rhamnusium bicolor TaxID=1586634 RepID=A0AAV8ZM72_9CUCU|nr:hypothetical protein NQ314_004040 [Rhamnusium bicolor]
MTIVHHALSVKRKWEVNPLINEDSRLAAQQTSIGEYVFGLEFLEKVNSSKSVKKSQVISLRRLLKKGSIQILERWAHRFLTTSAPPYKTRRKEWKKGGQEESRTQKRRSAEKSNPRQYQSRSGTRYYK